MKERLFTTGVSFALAMCFMVRTAHGNGVFVHVVRPGETLASIAQRYYGDPRRESILVAENGLNSQGGIPIIIGMRLSIPTVFYHRVQAGETWGRIAQQYYGDSRRASVLMEVNNGTASRQPEEGAEIIVPYPIRHVAAQHETLPKIAELYYGEEDQAGMLRRFNFLRGSKIQRGQVLLVPLANLVLAPEGRRIVDKTTGTKLTGGETRNVQLIVNTKLPELAELLRRGRFAEVVALGNRLLGTGGLTGNQEVTIQRAIATAYVALDRQDLAVDALAAALTRQPDLEVDTAKTSPRVLAALDRARRRISAARGRNPTPPPRSE